MKKSLRTVRVLFALAWFAALNLVFFGVLAGCGFLVKAQLLPALLGLNAVAVAAVAAATALLGRVYCSVVCPMGVFQDVVIRIARKCGRKDAGYRPPRNALRWSVFAAAAVAVAVGASSFAGLLDGYSLYGRFAAQLFKPVASWINNLVAWICVEAGHPHVFREEVLVRGMCGLAVAALGLAFIVALAWKGGRVFCNTLCPTGTLLAALARKPLVRVRIDADKCVGCGLCARVCKANCIDFKNRRVDDARCVRCFNCLGACRKDALSYGVGGLDVSSCSNGAEK